MGLEINANSPYLGGVQSNFFINPIQRSRAEFPRYVTVEQRPDEFSPSLGVKKYATKEAVLKMIGANPNIIKILKENGLPLQINMKVLNDLMSSHMAVTRNISAGMAAMLPSSFQKEINPQSLKDAANLHDFGKVLIPNSIVNKKGKLTDKEREIMQLHSILGYELLKTTDLNPSTLELIKYHHQNPQMTGYPEVNDFFISDVNSQILHVSDMYSALREERPYKEPMSKNQALGIIHKEMKQGRVHPYVFKALVDFVNKESIALNIDTQRQAVNLESENRLCA